MNDAQAETAIDPLIAEAVKKAAVAWIDTGGGVSKALWCLWMDDELYAVCGPGEQPDPGLAGAQECRVALRGDHGGRIVGFVASVSPVDPATARWEEVAATLAGKRLNAPPGDTAARWATECVVYRLAPRDAAPESGASLPSTSLAAPPVPSEATRVPRKPFRLHRVKKRRR